MQSAPVPRIEPGDRAIHEVSAPQSEPTAGAQDLRANVAKGLAPSVAVPRENPSRENLPREDLRKLHAALHELAECRKLIDAAVARTD